MIKLKYLFALAVFIPLFQNCGQAKDGLPVTIMCNASRVSPSIFINGTRLEDLRPPIVLPVSQNISFTVADPITGTVTCGPTDGKQYWIVNGGSRVNDTCAIFANPAVGNYTVKLVNEYDSCEPLVSEKSIQFEVQ